MVDALLGRVKINLSTHWDRVRQGAVPCAALHAVFTKGVKSEQQEQEFSQDNVERDLAGMSHGMAHDVKGSNLGPRRSNCATDANKQE